MAGVRESLEQLLKDRGLSLRDASLKIGRNQAYLHQFVHRGVPAKLDEDVRERLAPLLGVSPDALKDGPAGTAMVSQAVRRPVSQASAGSPYPAGLDRLPVMGMAECGPDGWSLWNGEIIDTVPRPASLAGAPQAYAVYTSGDSMKPRYHTGEVLHIHPGKPVTVGAYVLVQLKPKEPGEGPRAIVKLLSRRHGSKITLEQFNPPKSFDIKLDEILTMHRVIGSAET